MLAVLVVLLLVGGAATAFVWFMNRQQTQAGNQYRARAALYVAEAGVHRALSVFEAASPDGRVWGREWLPARYEETVRAGPLAGSYTLTIVADADGARIVTSTGQVAGVERRLRVRVYLASPALLAALYGAGIVKIDQPPAAFFIAPYGAAAGGRPWVHMMAGRTIWFEAADAKVNTTSAPASVGAGPVDAPGDRTVPPAPAPIRVVLPRGGFLASGGADQAVDPGQLRVFGVPIRDVIMKADDFPDVPAIDRGYFRSLAAANRENAAVNKAAGVLAGDEGLARKADSAYSGLEFLRILSYVASDRRAPDLRGVIFVAGSVTLDERQRLTIRDGALVVESTVHLSRGAEMAILHSSASRTMPGLIAFDLGRISLAPEARLRVHGLVYANKGVEAGERATIDVVGAVMSNAAGISFRATASTVVIRYDPAVLGTPGLLAADPGRAVTWIASWEELP
jgi:hypothetical protein